MIRRVRIAILRLGYRFLTLYWKFFKTKQLGVKIFLLQGDQVLLVRHTYGNDDWKMPGGSMKRGEAPEKAGKREVYEELGIVINSFDFVLGRYKRQESDTFESVVVLVATDWKKERENISPEIAEWKFFDIEELPEKTQGTARKRTQEYVDGKREIVGEIW